MSYGNSHFPKRKFPPALWAFLILAVLSMSFGGAWAYLHHSTKDAVINQFAVDEHPAAVVDESNRVKLNNTDYAVYLRAAVTVNWKGSSTVLAAMPVKGTDYTETLGDGWFLHTDGFYYYRKAVTKDNNQTTPVVTITEVVPRTGYTLVANIAVQSVQAVGTVDGGTTTAVEDAWGITPAQIGG